MVSFLVYKRVGRQQPGWAERGRHKKINSQTVQLMDIGETEDDNMEHDRGVRGNNFHRSELEDDNDSVDEKVSDQNCISIAVVSKSQTM